MNLHIDRHVRVLAELDARAESRKAGHEQPLPSRRAIDAIEHEMVTGSQMDDR